MALIEIDGEVCNQDGLCAAVCPAKLIDFERGTIPVTIDGAEELCIRCGHCVAVCPAGCLNHQDVNTNECPSVIDELHLSAEQCEQFLRSRRSIRNYKKKNVNRELLEKLIETARYAPTGHNSQGVEWLVLANEEHLQGLKAHVAEWMRFMLDKRPELALSMHMDKTLERWESGTDVILRDAPVVIVAHAAMTDQMAPASCTIALTYLELAATSLGLGCCWAGYFNAAANTFPPMQGLLGLPDGHQSFGAMMVGYPQFQYKRMVPRPTPKISWKL